MLKILFCTGRIKDNNLLLKIEIDSEFLILTSRLNQLFRVEGKNEYLKTDLTSRDGLQSNDSKI